MNTFLRILFFLLAANLLACSSDPAKKLPKDIIPEEKMKTMYIDVFLAEAQVQDAHLEPDEAKKKMQEHYVQIAKKYGESTQGLLKSMNYYTRHPQVYSEVLQPVIDSLSAMEARTR